jgi:hypothetical protein
MLVFLQKYAEILRPPEKVTYRTEENNNLFKSGGDIITEVNKP